ncbi:MAG: TlyA family RNA methyltransferase, partial [Actinomycetes bacterium]
AESRTQAHTLILEGRVHVGGAPADRPSRLVSPAEALTVSGPPPRYVSRGGHKLEAALDRFGLDVAGLEVLDAGASTGGFTDCLVQRQAAHVVAVDVGRGQLHNRMLRHPQVTSIERRNIRQGGTAGLPGAPYALVVADLSFISLRTVAGPLVDLTRLDGDLVLLVKPQFEAGRVEVSAGRGVIVDPEVWLRALRDVGSAFPSQGATMMGAMVSPLRGADGNVEFLVHLRRARPGRPDPAPAVDLAAVTTRRTASASRSARTGFMT